MSKLFEFWGRDEYGKRLSNEQYPMIPTGAIRRNPAHRVCLPADRVFIYSIAGETGVGLAGGDEDAYWYTFRPYCDVKEALEKCLEEDEPRSWVDISPVATPPSGIAYQMLDEASRERASNIIDRIALFLDELAGICEVSEPSAIRAINRIKKTRTVTPLMEGLADAIRKDFRHGKL